MSYPVLYPEAGDTIPIFFTTYGKTNGESVTCTGLAITDIEIYKDGSVTQRASDAGLALVDTDGIDIDSITGLHGFTIDLSDNTDAGFYEVGSWYIVVVSAITVDSQTVTFIAAMFRIVSATRGLAGTALPDAAADAAGGLPISDAGALDLDAIKAKTDNLPGDPADASDIAAAFAALNDLSAAEIRTALGMATNDLDTQLDAIAALVAATALRTALGLAAANLDTQIAALGTHLTDIKGTGFVKDTDSMVDLAHTGADSDTLEDLSDQIDAIGSLGGTGAVTVDETSLDDSGNTLKPVDALGNAIGDMTIRAFIASEYTAGTPTVRGTAVTNDDGVFSPKLKLDSGVEYKLEYEKDGYVDHTTTITPS